MKNAVENIVSASLTHIKNDVEIIASKIRETKEGLQNPDSKLMGHIRWCDTGELFANLMLDSINRLQKAIEATKTRL